MIVRGVRNLTDSKKTPKTKRPHKVTLAQIVDAIRRAGGNLTAAARALGISRQALYTRIYRSERLKAVVDEMREVTLDTVENCLLDRVKRGDTTAMIFWLKTQGKHRGWVERQEIDHRGDLTVQVVRYSDVEAQGKVSDGGGED